MKKSDTCQRALAKYSEKCEKQWEPTENMDERFLEDLKSRTDLVEVVKRYTELKKSGKNYMCRSPFRNERTPSFSVSPEKQLWYDFGSSEGGDVISFLEKMENFSFQETVETLAESAGVEVPKDFGGKKGASQDQKQGLYSLHEEANKYFVEQLKKHSKTQKYLKDRGIDEKTIQHWNLGYGGDVRDGLTKHLLGKGFKDALISQSGVAYERSFGDKTMQDRFWGRLMIPIAEFKEGRIIAFGGRDLSGKKDVAKYVNSPENPVYHKSATLFGLDRARKQISENDRVVLVEGYFDVIAAHNAGLPYTVATCGTALTAEHLRTLKRLTKNIILAFDTDAAGKKATLRSVEMCLESELSPSIVDIQGKDFDEMARESQSALKKAVQTAQPALQYLFGRFAEKLLDDTLEGKKKFLDAFFTLLKHSKSAVEQDHYLNLVADRIRTPKSVLEAEFSRFQEVKFKFKKPKELSQKAPIFTLEELFVGFTSAYWNQLEDYLPEEATDLLTQEAPRTLLELRLLNQTPEPKQAVQLSSWEMHQENLHGECPPAAELQKELEGFVTRLRTDAQKRARLESAKGIYEKLRS